MKIVRSEDRGKADHGWLQTRFTFSFADYYNPDRMQFGKVRVFNEDWIQPGMGFPTHPHNNMEIISVPFEGALSHKDSMGHERVVRAGEVQVMSAGTGVRHSEFNPSDTETTHMAQIWILPERSGVTPRYDQKSFSSDLKNEWELLVSGFSDKDSDSLKIHQDVRIYRGDFDTETLIPLDARPGYWHLIFLVSGELASEDERIFRGDTLFTEKVPISLRTTSASKMLWIETPPI